jgi:glutathione synthase/RimK-type ligase-like ATP-grasp enzyme
MAWLASGGWTADKLAARLRDLMCALGLTFGALDLIRTPDGRYVFLEVNPNGQWLWLEDRLDFPISRRIADWLTTQARTS